MTKVKFYNTWNGIFFKLMSNFVSTKVWILAIASVAMFLNIIDQYVWAGVVGGLFGIKELVKPMIKKAENGHEEDETDES